MLNQIITHTPVYVWAILAFLIVRGVIALRTRDVAMNKLFILPIVMTALSLLDVAGKFGFGGLALATWLVAAACVTALLFQFGGARVSPAAAAGHVIMRGSVWPLVLMMAIFVTKYVTSVAMAVKPALRADTGFMVIVCALFGIFSGYFLGRLARDVKAYRTFQAQVHGAMTPV